MTYRTDFSDEALAAAARHMKGDVPGVRSLLDAIDVLADDPRPTNAFPYGSPDVLRLRVGPWRALYQVYEDTLVVFVIHIGRGLEPA